MLSEMSRFTKAFILPLILLPGLLIGISGLILVTQEKQGLKGKYYPNTHWEGAPSVYQRDKVPYIKGAMGYNLLATDRYSAKWKGWIAIKRSGTYRFATHSDGGSSLQIDEQSVVDNGGTHGLKNVSGEIYLEKGAYPIEILYVHSGGESVLEVFWTPPGRAEQPLPAEVLFSENPEWTIGGMVRTVGSAKGFIFICYSLLLLVILIFLITILGPNVSPKFQNCEQNFSQPTHRIHFFVLILLPFFLLLLNRNVFISNIFHSKIDAWFYLGYFLNLPQHLHLFTGANAYFGDRLPFLIPGYLTYMLFPPLIAEGILHLGWYYGALFLFYALLKRTLNHQVAFLTALLFGSYYYTVWMYSWNYVDGAINTYFLCTIYVLTRGYEASDKKRFFFLAGVCTACIIYTNIHAMVLIPGIFIYFYACIAKQKRWLKRITNMLYFFVGIMTLHNLFGIINYLLTNDFFVLRESFEFIKIVHNAKVKQLSPFKTSILSSYWLILPVIVFIASLAVRGWQMLVKHVNQNHWVNLFQGCFGTLFTIYVLLAIKGFVFYLTGSCYFSFLNAAIFLVIGTIVYYAHHKLNQLQFSVVAIVVFVIVIVPLIDLKTFEKPYLNSPALAAEVVNTIKTIDPEGTIRFFFNAPDKDYYNWCGSPKFYLRETQTNLTEVYHNIASIYLWKQCGRILSDRLPEIERTELLQELKDKTKIVILTNNDNDLPLAQDSLAGAHVVTRVLTEKTIQENDISFKMIFLEVEHNKFRLTSSK